jgi:cell division septal protein FtsQ
MFGDKKKTDSRVRFQNSRFKNQLKQAREYKRIGRTSPRTSAEVFLSKLGLGSWLSRFATLLVFLLLIYLVFIPNIFFVKHTVINSSQSSDIPGIESLTSSFLDQKLPRPQKNLVLLSKGKLSEYLQKNDQEILKVTSVQKKFPSTLIINVEPRVDQFLIATASSSYFSVSNDGLITSQVFPDASGSLPSNLTSIKLDSSDGLLIGHPIFTQSQIDVLNQVNSQLMDAANSPVDYYELSSLDSQDFTTFVKSGLKIKFSFNSDITEELSRLKLLLLQYSASDQKTLYYIDMRFGDNGYVCSKGQPCTNETVEPNIVSTSTPVNQ